MKPSTVLRRAAEYAFMPCSSGATHRTIDDLLDHACSCRTLGGECPKFSELSMSHFLSRGTPEELSLLSLFLAEAEDSP